MKIQLGNTGALARIAKILFSTALLSTLVACGASNYPFTPLDQAKTYRVSSIAVIAGGDDDGTVKLAGFLTDGLTEKTKFRVMTQKDITARIPDYPHTIATNLKVEKGEDKHVWFVASEQARLNSIQAKLKVDYLFVVWNRGVKRVTVTSYNGGGSTTDYVYPAGNLLEYPGGKVVASTRVVAGSDLSPLALFRDKDYYILDALKDASSDIVSEFASVTKSSK